MNTLPQTLTILERLVGFDTVSRNSNLALVDYVAEYLAGFGVEATVLPDPTGTKANLLASIGPSDLPGFVLSGHMDVVPVDGQDWSRDPFRLTREGNRVYGRGTTDMKGFVACMLAAVPAMVEGELRVPLHLALTYDEEVGCGGAFELANYMKERLPVARAVFVGEPTAMEVVGAHKGSSGFATIVSGKACHSSRPDLGLNAIFHAAELVSELARTADRLQAHPDEASPFELPHSTVSVGLIGGGTAQNAIPGDCTLRWDIRSTGPGAVDAITASFGSFAESVAARMRSVFPGSGIRTTMMYDVPPFVMEEDSEAIRLARRFARKNRTLAVNYASEAGIFQRSGMPTVICGPGRDSEAHITDEWIDVAELGKCSDFIDSVIEEARSGGQGA